jgi:hypothetical protein
MKLFPLIDEGLVIATENRTKDALALAQSWSSATKVVHKISQDLICFVKLICN